METSLYTLFGLNISFLVKYNKDDKVEFHARLFFEMMQWVIKTAASTLIRIIATKKRKFTV